MELRELIADYLKEAKLMQLATSVDDQPWVCSVWFAADPDLNLYWFSSNNRRHSAEVLKNPRVAGAIVLPHTPEDSPRGLQFQGTASLIEDPAGVEHAMSFYADRIFSPGKIVELMNNEAKPHKFYKIKPTQFVLFDVVNFPDESRQQLDLPK